MAWGWRGLTATTGAAVLLLVLLTATRGAEADCCCPAGAGHFLLSIPTCFFGFLGSCAACPYGTYAPHGCGYGCLTCPQNTYTWNTASTSAINCLPCSSCQAGRYCANYRCDACPISTFKSVPSPTAGVLCTPCGPGKYTTSTGSQSVAMCLPCPLNTYKPGDTGTCLPCPANMGTTGAGAAACMCSPGYEFHAGWGNCTVCPANTYKSVTSNTVHCTVCPAGTTTTAAASITCVCRPGYGGSTMAECAPCPLNTYKDSTTFGPCTACLGGSITLVTGAIAKTQCVCPAGTAGKYNGPCNECAAGTYAPEPNMKDCLPCPALMTSKAGATVCTCQAGYYGPPGGPCVEACQPGYYGMDCIKCSPGCQPNTCADGNEGDGRCACKTGWTSARCDMCDEAAGWTSDGAGGCTCAAGRFGPVCDPCPACGHGRCDDGAEGTGACLCASGWTTDASGACTQCSSGRFGSDCDRECPSCHGNGECNDGVSGDGKCVCTLGWDPSTNCSTCSAGYYAVAGPGGTTTCARCDGLCATCNGPTNADCTGCHPGMLLTDGACLCDGPCADCADECDACFGPLTTQCTSCAAAYVLQDTTCQEACNDGYYDNAAERQCVPCHGTCATCTAGGSTNCTSCDVGSGRLLDLSTSACVTSCPAGTFRNDTVCALCDATCRQCADASADACTSCVDGLALHEGTCVAECPDGTYRTTVATCAACASTCATCSAASSSACTSCAAPQVLSTSGQCVDQCPFQTYQNDSRVCVPCHATCAYCSGSAASECTSCVGSFLQDGYCVSSCDAGYYASGLTCIACPAGCSDCTGAAACTTCTDPNAYLQNGACVEACDAAYAPRTSPTRHCEPLQPCTFNQYRKPLPDGTCGDCHPTCATCSGGLATECLSCAGLLPQETSCVETCSPGYYLSGARCLPCPGTCEACTSFSQCTACASPDDYLQDGVCVAECRSDYFVREGPPRTCEPVPTCGIDEYYAAEDNACLPCDASCLTCSGPDPTNCTGCLNKLLEDGACVDTCAPAYRRNGTYCVPCPEDCATCNDEERCTSCDGTLVVDDGRCVTACADGKEANEHNVCQQAEAQVTPSNGPEPFDVSDIISAAVIPVALVLVTLTVYFVCRRVEPMANNVVIFTVAFGLFDVITDAVFVYSLFQTSMVVDALRYVALASVAVPVAINLVASLTILTRLSGKNDESNEWFSEYYPLAALVSFVAAGCLGALRLLSSNLCNWRGFQARFDERDLHRIKQLELATLVIEDLPQLVIQILVITGYGVTPLTVVTLSASVFAVLFNVLQRFFYFLGHRHKKRLQKRKSVAESYNSDMQDQVTNTTTLTMELIPTRPSLQSASSGASAVSAQP